MLWTITCFNNCVLPLVHKSLLRAIVTTVALYKKLITKGERFMKVQLSDENRKIKDQLIWDFHSPKPNDPCNEIVKLVAEMTMQAIQLSQNDTNK